MCLGVAHVCLAGVGGREGEYDVQPDGALVQPDGALVDHYSVDLESRTNYSTVLAPRGPHTTLS